MLFPDETTGRADHSFASAEEARTYILGGRAVITARSARTSAHRVYRISVAPGKSTPHFVRTSTGAYCGHISGSSTFIPKPDHSAHLDAHIFNWIWRWLSERGEIPPSLQLLRPNRCGRCYRQLTDPVSIAEGFGPECRGKI